MPDSNKPNKPNKPNKSNKPGESNSPSDPNQAGAAADDAQAPTGHSSVIAGLLKLVGQWNKATSSVEGAFFEQQLKTKIDSYIAGKTDTTLLKLLDALWDADPRCYERCADLIEDRIQSRTPQGAPTQLFIAVPMMAWSRNQLPLGKTEPQVLAELKKALMSTCLAPNVQLQLGHTLYGPDSLPQGFAATHRLASKYFDAATQSIDMPFSRVGMTHVDPFYLADTRFWLGTLQAPAGSPLFKWQLQDELTEADFVAWNEAAMTVLGGMFMGCGTVMLPPADYFTAFRRAEADIRPFSLQSAALMVMSSLELEPDDLRVVIGACYERGFEEYRVSVMTRQSDVVLQGVSWPLLEHEEDETVLLQDIQSLLTAMGILRIKVLDDRLPMDYCDDCDAPLFPDMHADLVHTGPPDDEQHDHRKLIVH